MRLALSLVLVACSGDARDKPAVRPPPPPPLVTAATTLAATFSPEIVGAITPTEPTAGDYAMALDLTFDTFPTMELHISQRRTGTWRMSLAADGTATACLGARRQDVSNGQFHYEPPERRQHRATDVPRLVALGGTWKVTDGVATIVFDRRSSSTCDLANAFRSDQPVVTLRCIGVEPPARVTDKRLACEAAETNDLLDLGLPMTTALHVAAQTPMARSPEGRNVIFGSPGLAIEVRKDSRSKRSSFVFKPRAITLVEADFRPKP